MSKRLEHCRNCSARIIWVQRAGGNWLPVNPEPVSPNTDASAGAWVLVEHRTAYRPQDLAEVLMTSRSIALEDAFESVRTDFPWHRAHACPYPMENAS